MSTAVSERRPPSPLGSTASSATLAILPGLLLTAAIAAAAFALRCCRASPPSAR